MNSIEEAFASLRYLPYDFAHWVRTVNDTTYLSIMFVGAVILTFIVARSLR